MSEKFRMCWTTIYVKLLSLFAWLLPVKYGDVKMPNNIIIGCRTIPRFHNDCIYTHLNSAWNDLCIQVDLFTVVLLFNWSNIVCQGYLCSVVSAHNSAVISNPLCIFYSYMDTNNSNVKTGCHRSCCHY